MTRPQGLRRFTAPPGAPRATPGAPAEPAPPIPDTSQPAELAEEHCEFCATALPARHGHVADLEQSSLMCACRACYLLFVQPGASSLARTGSQGAAEPAAALGAADSVRSADQNLGSGPSRSPAAAPRPARSGDRGAPGGRPPGIQSRYRAVPDRYLRDSSRRMSVAEWEELQIPVGLAFFLHRSQPGQLGCFYPSPAGATECALDLPAWQRLAAAHPLLAAAEPDVEAVLISRGQDAAAATMEYFVVPIDACYELAGRMRMLWRGFDGGAEAHRSIEEFLGQVRGRAKDLPQQDARHG